MSHLKLHKDGSIKLVVDKKIFPRALVKKAASNLIDRCHIHLDLDGQGSVVVSFREFEGEEQDSVYRTAGLFGNLLLSELINYNMDAQTQAARNLLLARALDGSLPRGGTIDGT